METLIIKTTTVIAILGSVCSILGFAYLDRKTTNRRFRIVARIGFGIATVLCLFVCATPSSWFQFNVGSKIGLFTTSKEYDPENDILIQRGQVRLKHYGEYSIEFSLPFKELPEFEILNPTGDSNPPTQKTVSEHQAVIEYNVTPGWPRTFRWLARGKPLYPLKVVEVLEP